jgi:hypothetical protein
MLENPNAMKQFLETKENIKKAISEAVDTNEKTKNLPKETKDLIKFQGA